jgi:hypothetical protein
MEIKTMQHRIQSLDRFSGQSNEAHIKTTVGYSAKNLNGQEIQNQMERKNKSWRWSDE